MKKIIASPHAPKAVGPYSQAVEAGGTLYVSGQLPIDASTGRMAEGIEAQTLANTYMALEHDLELVPILNKIDLPSAHPDEVAQEVEDVIGLPCLDAPRVSAKTGLNVDQVL